MSTIDELTSADLAQLDADCADLQIRYDAAVRAFDYHDRWLQRQAAPWWVRALRWAGVEVTR